MIKKIRNPETGKWININGPTYKKLVEKGVRLNHQQKQYTAEFKPVFDKEVKPSKVKVNKKFQVDRSDVSWGQKKPHTVGERRQVMEKFGPDCFLIPSQKKFPICNKTSVSSKPTYNCKGLKAASSRAGEWKYKNVLKTSKKLTKELDCYKNKK